MATIAAVPVVLYPELSFPIKLDLAGKVSYSTSVTQSVTVTAGLDYVHGQALTPIGSYTHSVSSPGFSTTTTVDANLALDADVTTLIDDLAGPSFIDGIFLHFDAERDGQDPRCWQVTGGIQAGIGFQIPLLNFDKSNDDLVSNGWDIAHGGCAFDGLLTGVSCPTPNVCEAVGWNSSGGVVLNTTDAGATWTAQDTPETEMTNSIACPTTQRCLAAAGSAILSTSDGGQTWSTTSLGTVNAASISCPSATHCVAVGNGVAYTNNGGASWHTEKSPINGTGNGLSWPLMDVACPSVTVCQAVGAAVGPNSSILPAIARTTDAGVTWTITHLPFDGWVLGISCPSISECVGVGLDENDQGHITRTTNGGRTWSVSQPPLIGTILSDIACYSTEVCMAVGGGWDDGSGGALPLSAKLS